MSTGTKVTEQAIQAFNAMKMDKKYGFIVYKLTDVIDIDQIGEKSSTHDDLLKTLPANEPRYVIYDFKYTTHDGRNVEQLIFIFWCPDNTKVAHRMTYAASKQQFISRCEGVFRTYEAQDMGSMTKQELIQAFDK